MTDLEILEELRQKLAWPSAWHQGSWFARVPWNFGNSEANERAMYTDCPACLGGWLARITQARPWIAGGLSNLSPFRRVEQKLQAAMEQEFFEPDLDMPSPPDLFEWNDMFATEHKHVLQVIDTAISNERAKGL